MNNKIALASSEQVSFEEMRSDSKKFPRLKTYPREEAIYAITQIVAQAFLYKGQDINPDNTKFIAASLYDELMADEKYDLRYLALEEIHKIIKNAVLTTDMYGVSVASLYRVLVDYAKGEGNQIAKQMRNKPAPELANTAFNIMLQAYTGQFIKNNKA